MQIINNKISIVKGETPTYDAAIIEVDGSPLRTVIPTPASDDYQYYIEFVVRPSIYDREDDFVYKSYHLVDVHRFDEDVWVDYNEEFGYTEEQNKAGTVLWSDDDVPSESKKNLLFRRTNNKVTDYRYYDDTTTAEDGTHWIPYEVRLIFKFPYEYTSNMEAKVYKYEIALFGGVSNPDHGINEIPVTIDYKRPLLDATDFTVRGTLSE